MLISGAIVTEQIFNLRDGRYLFDASTGGLPGHFRDELMLATLVLFCNLAVDLTYAWLDPRVEYR